MCLVNFNETEIQTNQSRTDREAMLEARITHLEAIVRVRRRRFRKLHTVASILAFVALVAFAVSKEGSTAGAAKLFTQSVPPRHIVTDYIRVGSENADHIVIDNSSISFYRDKDVARMRIFLKTPGPDDYTAIEMYGNGNNPMYSQIKRFEQKPSGTITGIDRKTTP